MKIAKILIFESPAKIRNPALGTYVQSFVQQEHWRAQLREALETEVNNTSTTLKLREFLKVAKVLIFESPAKIRNH